MYIAIGTIETKERENLIWESETARTKTEVIKSGLIVCMNKLDFSNIVLENPWKDEINVKAIKKVKKVPTAPTYITSTIQDGSLYLSLLKPSIWKGKHMEAATAAIILETVVNILKLWMPDSGVSY